MMQKIIKRVVITVLFTFVFSQLVYASDELQSGLDALNNEDYALALEILQPLSDAGNADAQYALGSMYGTGKGVERDRARSFELISKSADQGNLDAMERYVAGYAFMPGADDAEVDAAIERGLQLYTQEADKGNTKAMVKLGGMHEMGFGVAESQDEAIAWYKKAAELGDVSAQLKLGQLFMAGVGGDKEDARAWFEKAAAQGSEAAVDYLDML